MTEEASNHAPDEQADASDQFSRSRKLNDELLAQGGARLEATRDQVETARGEMRADLESRGIDPRSDAEKWPDFYRVVGKSETLTEPPDAYDATYYDESSLPEYARGNRDLVIATAYGAELHGISVKSLSIGSNKNWADVEVLDISRRPLVERKGEGNVHNLGQDKDGNPIEVPGNYALAARTTDLVAFDVAPLAPGQMVTVGRADGNFGSDVPDLLPRAVSRDHFAIGLTDDGQVKIENHNPTFDTVVVKRNLATEPADNLEAHS